MKLLFILLTLTIFSTTASAQKTSPPRGRMAGTSDITKKEKRVAQFTLGRNKFSVYCGDQTPKWELSQERCDTLQVYKIAAQGATYSILEITKLATREGKIIAAGTYNITNDTLYVYSEAYDYMGAYRLTDIYVSDNYGLKKISGKMEAIKSETITDKYLKPAEMKTIFPGE
ncbi:MAG: hypothetical protein EOP54_17495 [Sphingobacteriales bacterium]|nr:MAG: hypothetical protein EOP54_17495 [Sphingobacteriales bacterium]